jgi:hypothetical protein
MDAVHWRTAAAAIDAEYTGPGDDRIVRYAAAYLRRRADEAERAEARPPVVNYTIVDEIEADA